MMNRWFELSDFESADACGVVWPNWSFMDWGSSGIGRDIPITANFPANSYCIHSEPYLSILSINLMIG
jgi:hypothetical protein